MDLRPVQGVIERSDTGDQDRQQAINHCDTQALACQCGPRRELLEELIATMREVRTEPALVISSVIAAYLLLPGFEWRRRLTLIATLLAAALAFAIFTWTGSNA